MMDLVIIFAAKYLYLLTILMFLVIVFVTTQRKKMIVLSLVAFPLALAVAKVLNLFIKNPRPFVVEHMKPLIDHAADNGFPSDHTLLTMTIAAIVFVYHRKLGIALAFCALVVGWARVMAKVHHPIDIVGSIIIAIVAVFLAKGILQLFKR